jgi:hypothetical protein
MESHLQGEVRWYHVARSRAVRRILERSIARWMEVHQLFVQPRRDGGGNDGSDGASGPQYRAVLQREGDGHFVHCQIEVLAGNQSWSGSRVGSGIQQALADCLAHMTLKTQAAHATSS